MTAALLMLILGLMQISMEGAFPASGFAVMNGALTDAMCVATVGALV